MSRKRRFFLATLPGLGERSPLPPALFHYAHHVLRLPPGTIIELFDGSGASCDARLIADGVEITSTHTTAIAPVPIRLACPLLKGDRSDWLFEKLTELGIAAYVPLLSERGVVEGLSVNKRARYERLIESACRQSGRNERLALEEPATLSALPSGIWLNPRASEPFDQACDELFSTAVRAGSLLSVAIGPEGGFSASEEAALQASGWRAARLATHVLRAETAAVMAASVAAMRWAG